MTDRAQPGTRLVEELRLLLDAAADRAGPWLDRVAATPDLPDRPEDPEPPRADSSVHPGHCDRCPLCALTALLRGEPNALAARGLDQAADLVALLRAVLADRWEPGEPHLPGFTPPGRSGGPDVEPIPVRRKGAR